eukprot:3029254-Pleurochrysis_carterae.AAC.1
MRRHARPEVGKTLPTRTTDLVNREQLLLSRSHRSVHAHFGRVNSAIQLATLLCRASLPRLTAAGRSRRCSST